MARIECFDNCFSTNKCSECPFIEPPEDIICGIDCLYCPNHCPCCIGRVENLCDKCKEEDCKNRTHPYNPDSKP